MDAREKIVTRAKWSPKDREIFENLFTDFCVVTARGRRRAEYEERLDLELPHINRKHLHAMERIRCQVGALQTRLFDLRRARNRECASKLDEIEKRFIAFERKLTQRDRAQEELRIAARGQERRHEILDRLRAQRLSELRLQEAEMRSLRLVAIREAEQDEIKRQEDRLRKRKLVREYRNEKEHERAQSSQMSLKRQKETQRIRRELIEKNRPRVKYRERLRVEKEKRAQIKIATEERERAAAAKRLNRLAEKVPYIDTLRALTLDRSRVQSDTQSFAVYKDTPLPSTEFGRIHGFFDEKVWADVRFKVQHAIRTAGLQQSDFVRRMFEHKGAAPF